MRVIETFREGNHISDVYLCKTKQIALTKNGKEYGSLVLQDKTGTVDAKIWELSSPGINEFSALDYVYVDADVTLFQGKTPESLSGVHFTLIPLVIITTTKSSPKRRVFCCVFL